MQVPENRLGMLKRCQGQQWVNFLIILQGPGYVFHRDIVAILFLCMRRDLNVPLGFEVAVVVVGDAIDEV